ncbi:unnamed protein product [Phytophthora fragariaefolia]|uniref:Unnamed protein product n=1 Tax=Phytophthora fragariaefolia TaxID=1490495 RepID=A0A9W7CJ79_9STRA|nr:unnamed protein product [Phytophthora fragariaefolia]
MQDHTRSAEKRFHQFGTRRLEFSDDLVGRVLPRALETRSCVGVVAGIQLLDPSGLASVPGYTEPEKSLSPANTSFSNSTETTPTKNEFTLSKHTSAARQNNAKSSHGHRRVSRREQCKIYQARYRSRQLLSQMHLENGVQQLREEVEHLKGGLEYAQFYSRTKYNPWVVVAETFRLLNEWLSSPWHAVSGTGMTRYIAFFQQYFSPDVTIGNKCGVKALMEQDWCWHMGSGDPELHLVRVEETITGVMTATAGLNVTATEITLDKRFLNLMQFKGLSDDLLGQRLHLTCSMKFFFDEETGLVSHLKSDVDIMAPLLQSLGNVRLDAFSVDENMSP